MKSPYVNELQQNQVTTATFLVQLKDIRQKKTGEPYLSLTLGDRTGEMDAKMWDNVLDVMDTFERDDFVKVKGLLQVYQNRPQFTIHKMRRLEEREIDFSDFFPCSTRDRMEMFLELRQIVAGIQNPQLRALLDSFLDDEAIAEAYRTAPAAKNVHHAYLGGLIEHVLSLCHLARMMAAHYPNVDLDLLLTGVVLHDIGKIAELSYQRSFTYSTEGQLLGHIVIGLRMIHDRSTAIPDFPPKLRTLVDHMILSHHGELEFGSPKVPLFPEALLLHHLDNMDSKMESMRAWAARDRLVEGCWTAYNTSLGRVVLKKAKYLEVETATFEDAEEPSPISAAETTEDHPSEEFAAPAQDEELAHISNSAAAQPATNGKAHGNVENSKQQPETISLFAEKLKQAWVQER